MSVDSSTGDLFLKAREGRDTAIEILHRRSLLPLRPAVRRSIGRWLRPRVDTDEICQSTFRTAVRHLSEFRYRGWRSFVAWLRRIAVTKIRGRARFHSARVRDSRRERRIEACGDMMEAGPSPSCCAEVREEAGLVRDALDRLPEPERTIVRMRSIEEKSFREIAENLGLVDWSAARRAYHRALVRLAQYLA